MKHQGKNLQDKINEEEIGNLLEKEFRVMIVKMSDLSDFSQFYQECYIIVSHRSWRADKLIYYICRLPWGIGALFYQ